MVSLAESLITALQQPGQERLRDLVRNPLCLTLLCHVWDGSGLPDTQAELYGNYLRKHYLWNQNLKELENHAKRCDKDITQVKAELQQALGELAKAALETPGEGFRLSQDLLEQYLGEEINRQSLCPLALQLGLLNRTNIYRRGNNTFAFYHATFQEYFAALAIPDWYYFLPREHTDRPIPGRAYRIFDPQWRQVILVWLGRGDLSRAKKEEFINRLVNFDTGCNGNFYDYKACFLAAAGINEFKACSLAREIVRQVVEWGFGYFNIEKQKWQTFVKPVEEGARERIPETIRQLAIAELIAIIKHSTDEDTRKEAAESLGSIGKDNPEAIAALVELIYTTDNVYILIYAAKSLCKIDKDNAVAISALVELIRTAQDETTRRQAAYSLGRIGKDNPEAIAALVELIRTTHDEVTRWWAAASLGSIDKNNPMAINMELVRTAQDEDIQSDTVDSLESMDKDNPVVIKALVNLIGITQDEDIKIQAAFNLGSLDKDNPVAITALVELSHTAENEDTRLWAIESLEKIGKDNPVVISALVELICTTEYEFIRQQAAKNLAKILTMPEQYAGVVSALKDNLNDEVYQNNFDLFEDCYRVLWQCAENLPYPEFYQAWHSHPEVADQTPLGHNSTVAILETQKIDICQELQNLPIFCLKAQILAAETRESEIAATLCQLIWDKALPDADYPEAVTTPSDLRKHLKQLKINQKLPKLSIIITECKHPTPALISFCYKLTNIASIAWLTDTPLEAPLKGFPPDQPNLLSAIQTWLEET